MRTAELVESWKSKIPRKFNGIVLKVDYHVALIRSKLREFDNYYFKHFMHSSTNPFTITPAFRSLRKHDISTESKILKMIRDDIPHALRVYDYPNATYTISLCLYDDGKEYERISFVSTALVFGSSQFLFFLRELISFIRYTIDGSKYVVYGHATIKAQADQTINPPACYPSHLDGDQFEYAYEISDPFQIEQAVFAKLAGDRSMLYQTVWDHATSAHYNLYVGKITKLTSEMFKKIEHRPEDLAIYNKNYLGILHAFYPDDGLKTYELGLMSVDEVLEMQ